MHKLNKENVLSQHQQQKLFTADCFHAKTDYNLSVKRGKFVFWLINNR